jgi:hypothetical protein
MTTPPLTHTVEGLMALVKSFGDIEILHAIGKVSSSERNKALENVQSYAVWLVDATAVDAAAEALKVPGRCEYCDDTGDVHGIDGEWRGRCTCKAGSGSDGAAPLPLSDRQIVQAYRTTPGLLHFLSFQAGARWAEAEALRLASPDTAAAQPADKDIQAWGDRNAIKQGLDELRVMVDDARSLAPSVVADLGQWATSRFGVFESDGSFRELPERGWVSDPLAHTARWVGGINDAQLLRAALAATPGAKP